MEVMRRGMNMVEVEGLQDMSFAHWLHFNRTCDLTADVDVKLFAQDVARVHCSFAIRCNLPGFIKTVLQTKAFALSAYPMSLHFLFAFAVEYRRIFIMKLLLEEAQRISYDITDGKASVLVYVHQKT